MGLGPHGSSLLQRLERPMEPAGDTLWYAMEQEARRDARMQARIRHQQKHKTPKKPKAPVEQTNEKHPGDGARLWKWVGVEIASKGLLLGDLYASDQIREAGFKLPKLQKQTISRVCKDCKAVETSDQREYDKDCACGGVFQKQKKTTAGGKHGKEEVQSL